jgi:hypothetical protein
MTGATWRTPLRALVRAHCEAYKSGDRRSIRETETDLIRGINFRMQWARKGYEAVPDLGSFLDQPIARAA